MFWVCVLSSVQIALPTLESVVGMLAKLAYLYRETFLWYPRPGLSKYFKRIGINCILDQMEHLVSWNCKLG